MSAREIMSIAIVIANLGLFVGKLVVGIMFNSLAVLSDAANSFVDIVTSLIIAVAVRVGAAPADDEHPFGHSRAEPLAAFTVAVLTFVLAFEVAREAISRLLHGHEPILGLAPILALGAVIAIKAGIFLVARIFLKKENSPALHAAMLDAKMDVVISTVAIGGVVGTQLGYPLLDGVAALAISGWIAWIGWTIGRNNIDKLMGGTPDEKTMQRIHDKLTLLKREKRIHNFHELRVHHVGSDIHVALHIDVAGDLSLRDAHDLDEEIQDYLKNIPGVTNVAIHVDPL